MEKFTLVMITIILTMAMTISVLLNVIFIPEALNEESCPDCECNCEYDIQQIPKEQEVKAFVIMGDKNG